MIVSDTGAKFTFPHLEHNKTVTVKENATLKVEFNISSHCNSTQNLTNIIAIERSSNDQHKYEQTQRFCHFVHVNGSCVRGTSECSCPTNSTELYTLTKTVDRSYNGTWTWSADSSLVQQTHLDVIINCKYFRPFLVSFCTYVYATKKKKNTQKRKKEQNPPIVHPSLT